MNLSMQNFWRSAPPRSTGMEFFQANLWIPPQGHDEKTWGTNGPTETDQFQRIARPVTTLDRTSPLNHWSVNHFIYIILSHTQILHHFARTNISDVSSSNLRSLKNKGWTKITRDEAVGPLMATGISNPLCTSRAL